MSLLLDALKKAAEEKQRMGHDVQAPVRPRPQAAGSGDQNGTQLMNLLQGKDQGHDLDNVEGFEPFGDEETGKSGFSLSLIDEGDESLDKLGFKEQPLPEPEVSSEPEFSASASFTLELLDEEDDTTTLAAPAIKPEPSITSLTLLDDDEPVPAEPVTPPVTSSENASDESPVKPDLQVTPGHQDVTEDEVMPSDESVFPVETTVLPLADIGVEKTEADTPHVVATEVLTDPASAAPAPIQNTPEQAGQPEDKAQAEANSQVFEAAPEMVLDALQRRRRRQRVLVLVLLLSVGLAAGGWGFLMYEEQLQRNEQILARYKLRPSERPEAMVKASVPTKGKDGSVAAISEVESANPTVATLPAEATGQQAEVLVTTKGVTGIPDTSAAKAVEAALAQDLAASKSGSTTVQGSFVSSVQGSPGAGSSTRTVGDTGRVAVNRTLVDQGIIESGVTLGIERRRTEARVLSAYRAFQDGDIKMALSLYQQALAEDPFSRDAVMGLAAIAATERDYGKAAYYYKQLLDYDPTDASAFEGLVGLPDTGLDLVDMESRLRNFLATNPDSARGQARLGRVMAGQERWHEAQQAFFNAHRLNPDKAAYALNVAIALDHLRKYGVAKRYYEQALMLGSREGKGSNLNLTSARQRLNALSQLED